MASADRLHEASNSAPASIGRRWSAAGTGEPPRGHHFSEQLLRGRATPAPAQQSCGIGSGHVHKKIDPVHERTPYPVGVTLDLGRGHRHARSESPRKPHGHGFAAPTRVKRAGYVVRPSARTSVTIPSSSG